MKKKYLNPELSIDEFKIHDVIVCSEPQEGVPEENEVEDPE